MSSPQTIFFLVQCLFYDIWSAQMEVNKQTRKPELNDFSVIIPVPNRSK